MNKVMRFKFRKGFEVRFLSHLDLVRTMERAIRRAGLPMAYSEGFTPRPMMSYGYALPVGILSEAEYGDFTLTEDLDPDEFVRRYNQHLPKGLELVCAQELPEKAPTLMGEINAASWRIELPQTGCSPEQIMGRWQDLQNVDSFVVERETKRGTRQVNVRPFLIEVYGVKATPEGTELQCLCGLGNEANLRMEELGSLLGFDHLRATITRTGQYKKVGNHYFAPLGNRG